MAQSDAAHGTRSGRDGLPPHLDPRGSSAAGDGSSPRSALPVLGAVLCALGLALGLLRHTVALPEWALVVGAGLVAARLVLLARGRWPHWGLVAVVGALAGGMAAPRLPSGSATGGAWLLAYTGALCLAVAVGDRRGPPP